MEPEHPGCAFSVPAPGCPQPSSASWSHCWRSTGASGGEGRGGSGEKEDHGSAVGKLQRQLGRVTHVLIYSTSSITLLLLLTPGDLFNCFFESQYCHFIIPRLPLLLIKKEKEGEEEGQNSLCHQEALRSWLLLLQAKDWDAVGAGTGLGDGRKLTRWTYLSGHTFTWVALPFPRFRTAPGLGVDQEST